MGVKGFYRILVEEGLVPDDAISGQCCSTSIWRDPKVMHDCPKFASNVSIIKKRSTFYIDGSGLCFHLYRVAFARHVAEVISSSINNQQQQSSPSRRRRSSSSTSNSNRPICSIRNLRPEDVTQLLPNLVPLTKIDEVTREFVDTLKKKHHIKLVVYFDGELRRETKREVDEKRQEKRPVEWSVFQQYCCNGIMPAVDKICQWEELFPKNKLFIRQVKHTLQLCQVETVICNEEADAELAKQATTGSNASSSYVVAMDTDFCFFKGTKYIPLKSLHANGSVITGCVITRKGLAESLHLPDEQALVELSILMGNDYVGTSTKDRYEDFARNNNNPHSNNTSNAKDAMDHLRANGKGYKVTSISGEETAEAIRFSRAFYNLQEIQDDDFPLFSTKERTSSVGSSTTSKRKSSSLVVEEYDGLVLKVPSDFPDHLSIVQPQDISLLGTVMRCLQAYLDQCTATAKASNSNSSSRNNKNTGASSILRQEHLEALKLLSQQLQQNRNGQQQQHLLQENNKGNSNSNIDHSNNDSSSKGSPWRPSWDDVPACHLIESCIGFIIKRSFASPLVRLSPPCKVFDAYKFHYILNQMRNQQQQAVAPNSIQQEHSTSNISSSNRRQSVQRQGSRRGEEQKKQKFEERPVLPIDEHEENILETIQKNRVTIIQGETGCGKSSRVPIMIMKAPVPDDGLREVKLFISQPRRIAAKALVERLRSTEPELGKRIALRMGHGVREYENSGTKAWFVTTGYLVRLLSNHPENFKKISHLIIDEIHERSVDTDILCLLCRRLLHTHPHIRLILMSATLAAELYQEYFDIAEPPIMVGARRFPITEVFVEDLPDSLQLSPKDIKAVRQIEAECIKTCCIAPPSNSAMDSVYMLAARIAIAVGTPGSSVLIFVPGMKDIESITELVEKLYVPGVTYACIPVHSDIPFDDQMLVFHECPDECKIIIATNAAESSITLPDCDHVICTGLQKQITYNASSHRQMLLPCWISKASAQQRSGRVGRVRPGTVFRLYTREAYETMMMEFESGEMLRMPLDSVILMLKEILHEDTTPALMNCLEPPDLRHIERSFDSLHKSNFITEPNDSGKITVLGGFVSALGIDLELGRIIGLGIQFGVGPEAIELAAVLSFPKTPWILSNPLVHKPKAFNAGTVKTFVSRNCFDASTFSEPLATINLIHEYSSLSGSRLSSFCNYNGIHNTRIRRLIGAKKNLVMRVAEFLKLDPSLLKATMPPSRMHHSKLTILRIIQVWVFNETIIEYNPLPYKARQDGSFNVGIKSYPELEAHHLESLLRSDRHPNTLKTRADIEQAGGFSDDNETVDLEVFLSAFEERFVSYVTEKKIDLAWFWSDQGLQLYPSSEFYETPDFQELSKVFDDISDKSALYMTGSGTRRGRGERACGQWKIQDPSKIDETDSTLVLLRKYSLRETSLGTGVSNSLRNRLRKNANFKVALWFDFSKNTQKNRTDLVFQIFCTGENAFKVSEKDLCDLVGKSKQNCYLINRHHRRSQNILFSATGNTRPADDELGSSIRQPLLRNAPEGARLLATLAASRRRDQRIYIPISENDDGDDEQFVSFSLENGLSKMLSRWTRFDTEKHVFVFENSVPASVIPVNSPPSLYCCAANALEVRGGAIRAEGLTLLPPGSLFLLLALLAFGLTPCAIGDIPEDDEDIDDFVASCVSWLRQKDVPDGNQQQEESGSMDPSSRIRMAIDFYKSCIELGEKLVCFPEKVKLLCELFDQVDGYDNKIWPKLESNPFMPVPEHVRRSREALLASLPKPGTSYSNGTSQSLFDGVYPDMQNESGRIESPYVSRQSSAVQEVVSRQSSAVQESQTEFQEVVEPLRGVEVLEFPDTLVALSKTMFATGLDSKAPDSSALHSTNVLALCAKQLYASLAYDTFVHPDKKEELLNAVKRFGEVQLTKDHWTVESFDDHDGSLWYRAVFADAAFPLKTRGTKGLRGWIRYSRPWTMSDALECVPSQFRDITCKETEVYEYGVEKRFALLFENIEIAIRMEAAFCLDRWFSHTGPKHWYEQSFPELMAHMNKRVPSSSEVLRRLDNR